MQDADFRTGQGKIRINGGAEGSRSRLAGHASREEGGLEEKKTA